MLHTDIILRLKTVSYLYGIPDKITLSTFKCQFGLMRPLETGSTEGRNAYKPSIEIPTLCSRYTQHHQALPALPASPPPCSNPQLHLCIIKIPNFTLAILILPLHSYKTKLIETPVTPPIPQPTSKFCIE